MEKGTNVNLVNDGKTPLDFAKDEEIITLLRNYGGKTKEEIDKEAEEAFVASVILFCSLFLWKKFDSSNNENKENEKKFYIYSNICNESDEKIDYLNSQFKEVKQFSKNGIFIKILTK